jgi:hypothetical protein
MSVVQLRGAVPVVTRTTIHKPSKVDRARERLSDAVARLESALPDPADGATGSEETTTKITELMAETETLQSENNRLRTANRQVSERLGVAIGRFKRAIGD